MANTTKTLIKIISANDGDLDGPNAIRHETIQDETPGFTQVGMSGDTDPVGTTFSFGAYDSVKKITVTNRAPVASGIHIELVCDTKGPTGNVTAAEIDIDPGQTAIITNPVQSANMRIQGVIPPSTIVTCPFTVSIEGEPGT